MNCYLVMDKFLSSTKRRDISDTSTAVEMSSNVPKVKRRRYNDAYISFGFTSIEIGGEDRPRVSFVLKY